MHCSSWTRTDQTPTCLSRTTSSRFSRGRARAEVSHRVRSRKATQRSSLTYRHTAGRAAGRQYVLAHFQPTPYRSYGCELHWNIPATTQFHSYYGRHQLDIVTSTGYAKPFLPTWNSVIAGSAPTPWLGVFGTVNAVAGADAFVNSAACRNAPPTGKADGGMGLNFLFKFADWVEQAGTAAGMSFYSGWTGPPGVFKGPYLTYSC